MEGSGLVVGRSAGYIVPTQGCATSLSDDIQSCLCPAGDHSLTAMAIGRMLGIVGDKSFVLTGPEVDRMNDDALKAIVKDCNVFARASPENKLRIVRALQVVLLYKLLVGFHDCPPLLTCSPSKTHLPAGLS